MPVVGKLQVSTQLWAVQHFLMSHATPIVVDRIVCMS